MEFGSPAAGRVVAARPRAAQGRFRGDQDECGEVDEHAHTCVPVFQGNTSYVFITEGDVVTNKWTILRVMN